MTAATRLWDSACLAYAADRERAANLVRVQETDFLPAALEIIERPVSPTARFTARVLLAAVLLAVVWLATSMVDIIASAGGELIPVDNVKIVQPAESGVVRAILVQDGQRVRAGQVLVRLDPTMSSAEAAQARKALQTAELAVARDHAVLAALDGRGLVLDAPADTPPGLVAEQRDLARAQLDDIRAAATSRSADLQAAQAAHAEAAGQARKLGETLPLLDVQIDALQTLMAKGFASRLRIVEMQRQRLATARDRDIALDTMRRASAEARSAGGTLAHGDADARKQVLEDLVKVRADADLRRDELRKAVQKASFQDLRSPVDGTVGQLAIHTIGGVVESAKPIMTIIPADGALVAQVKVLNRDIGFVRTGQPVALKLAAFPFTRFGTVAGRVAGIASDAVRDEKLGLVYVARVTIGRRTLRRSGETIMLTPGMEVTADIRTGRRSVASYLLSPIDQVRQEAGRER